MAVWTKFGGIKEAIVIPSRKNIMKLHFGHFKLISAPKPYSVSLIRKKGILGIKANTPKHLFGVAIFY
jgi:hypothetical protein